MGALIFLPFAGGLLVFLTVIWFIYLFLRFVLYVVQSFGLLRIAKREQYPHPGIVWIPGAAHYVLGRFCMDKRMSIAYAITSLLSVVVLVTFFSTYNDILAVLEMVFSVAYFVFDMIVMKKFYRKVYRKPELLSILTICSVGLLKPVFIYLARIRKITVVEL